MFYRLLSRIRKLGASEYWRLRALRAEEALEAEANRNRAREDVFVSAAVLGARGMWGQPPRTGPARTQAPVSLLDAAAPTMSGADRMEFEQFWLPDAMRNNIPRQQAEKDFLQELVKRKALNDEPTM